MAFGSLRFAAAFLIVSAVLHLMLLVMGGGLADVVAAVAAILLGMALGRGWRWLGWFVLMWVIVAVGASLGRIGTLPSGEFVAMALAGVNALIAASLLVTLWRPRQVATDS